MKKRQHDQNSAPSSRGKGNAGNKRVRLPNKNKSKPADDDKEVELKIQPDSDEEIEGEEDEGEDFGGGFKLEPFNLKDERERGKFDEQGNYEVKKRGDEEEDAWLNDYDKEVEEYALKGKKYPVAAKARQTYTLDDQEDEVDYTKIYQTFNDNLQPGETVNAALRRLGGKSKGKGKATDKTEEDTSSKELFSLLTESAHSLLSNGYYSVYSDSKEAALQKLIAMGAKIPQNETVTHNNTTATSTGTETKWEYKSTDGIMQGPFTTQQILDWKSQGYFTGENVVQMRQVKEESIFDDSEEPFQPSDQIDFQQFS